MKFRGIVSSCATITQEADKIIINELKSRGFEEIHPSHGGILKLLFDENEYTMAYIAQAISRTKPTVTTLVDKLEKNGYIVKQISKEDKRVTYVKITQKGMELKPIFEDISEKLNLIVNQNFDDKFLDELENALKKMVLNFRA